MPLRFNTLQLHAGQDIDPSDHIRARALPIHATTSYVYNTSEQAAAVFSGKEHGYVYSRVVNPTNNAFEERMAALEGGVAALATSSGQAASFIALTTLVGNGDNIVASPYLYGGSYNQLKVLFKRMGVTVRFTKEDKPEEYAALIDDNTRAVFFESIGNPAFTVPDIENIAKVAHDKGVPVVVDNTCGCAGFLIRPFDHGADIVVHSATKWIGGHGTTIGGVIVDSGKFPWKQYPDRFPQINTPSESYKGMVFADAFGPAAFIMASRLENLRDVGPAANPFGSFLLLQGLETLSLRVERQSQNALKLAQWLEKSPHVSWVSYLGLPSHAHHEPSKKYLQHEGLYGSVLTVGFKPLENAAEGDDDLFKSPTATVVDNLKVFSILANLGDSKSLVINPWSSTHDQLSDKEKLASGITKDMIRLSVGTEDISDLIEDFEQSFKAVYGEN